MIECTGTAIYIDPPEPVQKEREELLHILNVQEIELSMTDTQGNETIVRVLGRIVS